MTLLQVNVPPRIRVGEQKRGDTYTGRLGYVIYYDDKGVIRKEKSWQSWRDQEIEPRDFPNEPTEGFVLNRGGGGTGGGGYSSWDARKAFVRVYDPRNFEIEIGVDNLLLILRETGSSPGKALDGAFVYAWNGTQLVLLPAGSQDYQNSVAFTALQGKSVHQKDLVPGGTYITKKQEQLIYLGCHEPLVPPDAKRTRYSPGPKKPKKAKAPAPPHVFLRTTPPALKSERDPYVYLEDAKTLGAVISSEPNPDYYTQLDTFLRSPEMSPIATLELVPTDHRPDEISVDNNAAWWSQEGDFSFFVPKGTAGNKYQAFHRGYQNTWRPDTGKCAPQRDRVMPGEVFSILGGKLQCETSGNKYDERGEPLSFMEEHGLLRLQVTLESGEKYWVYSHPHTPYGRNRLVRELPRAAHQPTS